MITKALIMGFNRNDVYIHCDCPDFKYRYGFYATRNKINSGEVENRPSNQTNPDDKLGSGCKHILLVLTNTSWLIKVATVIYNYIKYIADKEPKLYQEIIFPALYGIKYTENIDDSNAIR